MKFKKTNVPFSPHLFNVIPTRLFFEGALVQITWIKGIISTGTHLLILEIKVRNMSSTLNKNQKAHRDTGPGDMLSSVRAKADCIVKSCIITRWGLKVLTFSL